MNRQIGIIFLPESSYDIKFLEAVEQLAILMNEKNVTAVFIAASLTDVPLLAIFKKHGTRTMGLGANEKTMLQPWLIDNVVIFEGHDDVVYDIFQRTCDGIILITDTSTIDCGSLSGKILVPCVVLSTVYMRCTSNYAGSMNATSDPNEALNFALKSKRVNTVEDAEAMRERAIEFHSQCYPTGLSGNYLESSDKFLLAAFTDGAIDNNFFLHQSLALYYDAIGDHYYYHVEDYLMAASYYMRAARNLQVILPDVKRQTDEFYNFLLSIIMECVALSFNGINETHLTKKLVKDATRLYRRAATYCRDEKIQCYKHTIAGLQGWTHYLDAKEDIRATNAEMAYEELRKAKALYNIALRHLPIWRDSGFSDNYQRTLDEVSEMDVAIMQLRRSKDD